MYFFVSTKLDSSKTTHPKLNKIYTVLYDLFSLKINNTFCQSDIEPQTKIKIIIHFLNLFIIFCS